MSDATRRFLVCFSDINHPDGGLLDYVDRLEYLHPGSLETLTLEWIKARMFEDLLEMHPQPSRLSKSDAGLVGIGRGDIVVTVLNLLTDEKYIGHLVYEDGGQLIDIYPSENQPGFAPLSTQVMYSNVRTERVAEAGLKQATF